MENKIIYLTYAGICMVKGGGRGYKYVEFDDDLKVYIFRKKLHNHLPIGRTIKAEQIENGVRGVVGKYEIVNEMKWDEEKTNIAVLQSRANELEIQQISLLKKQKVDQLDNILKPIEGYLFNIPRQQRPLIIATIIQKLSKI